MKYEEQKNRTMKTFEEIYRDAAVRNGCNAGKTFARVMFEEGMSQNLERCMDRAGGRFGGHIVSGHIDGTGTIRELKREGNAVWVTIDCSPKILRYIIEKGSIAIDGISLTVAYVDDTCFKVSIIPHTAGETTLLVEVRHSKLVRMCLGLLVSNYLKRI